MQTLEQGFYFYQLTICTSINLEYLLLIGLQNFVYSRLSPLQMIQEVSELFLLYLSVEYLGYFTLFYSVCVFN